MIKIRLTFINNEVGHKELNKTLEKIKKDFNILNESKIYNGRGKSQYNNIYLNIEEK
ncbi:hypothetical protein [Clostridium paraputrificum]|uniref:hypothetical protein n=1 Tax=Clostridium paraputrificum TaxID=29363 RepID=UPI00189E71B2|nr:hypothetical protein [Clostridium paraputrificum]